MKFTPQTVAALTLPPGKPYLLTFDAALPGFGIKISAGGSRQWVTQYRDSLGKTRRQTLGRVDVLSLPAARKAAAETLARVRLGSDPHVERKAAIAAASVTFDMIVDRYLANAEKRLRASSYGEVERHLKVHVKPLHSLPIHGVRRADLAARLSEIAEERGPYAANRVRSSLSALFAWAVGAGIVENNPVIGSNKATAELARDRVLTDPELTAIWRACRDDDHGRITRLLILLGQRRDEVACMTWSELDLAGGLWRLPAERTKNGRSHDVPLSHTALSLISETPAIENRDYLFGEGKGAFSGFSRAKRALDERTGLTAQWRLHDLRRTCATGMANLGTLPHVVEAVLNHVSGTRAGVAGIYNRASYSNEKRAALELWAKHVTALVAS